MKKTIISVLTFVLLLFSVLSGCKMTKKALKKNYLKEHLSLQKDSSSSVIKIDSSTSQTIDTTKTVKQASEKTTTRKTTEITIDLDSGSKSFDLDSAGDFNLNKMVNAALKHAKSIRMKVEEEQTKEKKTAETEKRHISKTESNLKKESAKQDKSSKQDRDIKKINKEAVIEKDSTISTNWIRLWPILVIALLIGAFLIYKKLK